MRFPTVLILFFLYTPACTASGGLRKRPCPGKELGLKPPEGHPGVDNKRLEEEPPERRLDGLLNEGKGCWGWCDKTPGKCDYCGTGQCCRDLDHRNGVPGCELANGIKGAKCGNFAGDLEPLRNVGLACFGKCNNLAGKCDYCGPEGSCCRPQDGDNCVPGCELANERWAEGGPGSQCGDFASSYCTASNPGPNPSPSPPTRPTNLFIDTPTSSQDLSGLQNEGVSCGGQCVSNSDGWDPSPSGGDCSFCGSGQCCSSNDWRQGVPGCELAQNVTQRVCGLFSEPHPEPTDFRLGEPLGLYDTPSTDDSTSSDGLWIKDIDVDGSDPGHHETPVYDGEGGQPWSEFEMKLVRDLLTSEMRQASAGRDELSTAKFLRLPFHDCLHYEDGTGGCDGCLNWDKVGFRFEGRVEERNLEDFERTPSNNGLGFAVEFLEYIYQLDFGKTWGGCFTKPGSVVGSGVDLANTRTDPIWVTSVDECKEQCINTTGCRYFTVPHMRFVDGRGPCRLFSEEGTVRDLSGVSSGRLIAGDAHCSSESWSLQSRGKSRADLWAFASLVAVEEGIQRHNWACDGDRRSPHNGPVQCLQFEGEEGCKITMPRPFTFKTGRKDCNDGLSYKTEKKEKLPDEHFNGTMTVRFMEDQYKFSGKETVAIMGAHTIGRFQQRMTGHKYLWTSDFQAFNNQYYRNIAGKDDWFFDDEECTRVGDAWGNKGTAVWIAKMNQVFRTGGPIQWIQKKVVCPNCADRSYERGGRHPDRLAHDRDCCLNNVPEGAQCRPDGSGPPGSHAFLRDDDFSDGCEYSHFIFGRDEAALGSDMGLMHKFDVDTRGFPSGCPGLGTFYPSGHRFSDVTCGIDGRPWFEDPTLAWNDANIARVTKNDWTDQGCPANCGRNDYRYPGDDLTLADHVERYADDQDAWIQDFIPAMEKMISNGYEESELVTSFGSIELVGQV